MANDDYVFGNWAEAADNAPELLKRGAIDHGDYQKILARANAERSNIPPSERGLMQSGPAQQLARSVLAPLLGLPGDVANFGAHGIHKATNFVERQFGLPESAGPDFSKNVLPTSRSAGAVAEYGARGIHKGVNFVERQLGLPESSRPESSTANPGSNQDIVFNNWTEAATHAPELFKRGAIDLDEYQQIMARGKAERTNAPKQPGAVPPSPENGRAMPVQSLPSWEQVQRFMQELGGPRPAY